jgi:predicted phage terminase large subunit-like protein
VENSLLNESKIKLLLAKKTSYERSGKEILHFTKWTNPRYQTNWHHRILCEKLDKFVRGEITRLIVLMPPRNGKSELVSRRLPAFAFGLNPHEQIMSASYGQDLASKMNRDVQRIMDSEQYKKIFPNVTLPGPDQIKTDGRTKYIRNAKEFEIVGSRGMYRCAGVGGAITGTGFTLGIIDDPIKNRAEADSATYREKIWDWYTSTFYTRKEENARILVTVTRWHEDDLVGRLLKKSKEDKNADQWDVVEFPAIRDERVCEEDPRSIGEPLWPEKFPLTELVAMKAVMGSREWSSLQQQTPITEGGNIVKRDWWKYYDELPRMPDEWIQSWDLTFKESGNSYVVGQVWMRKGANKYLVDQFRQRIGFVETISAIQTMTHKWPQAGRKLIEDKANGPAVIDALKNKISGIIPISPEGSKESRANAVSAQIESGNVWLPRNAIWVHDYIEEWAAFPNGADNDQVDATTQALKKLDISGIERMERFLTF